MTKYTLWFYRLAYLLNSKGFPSLGKLVNLLFVRIISGCQIGLGVELQRGVQLSYGGLGVVIHPRATIGEDVVIGDDVTIGGTTKKGGVPVIGDGCLITTGAVILGPVTLGSNCVVGANSVVTKSFPENCVVAGVPAKVIKENININDYREFKFR